MQTVDRAGYLAWRDGFLLKLERGAGVIVPERDCIAADAALARGEKVALTVDSKIVSYVEPREDGYYEVKAK